MPAKKDNTLLGICLIVATVCTMALSDALVKYFSATFPLWQIFVVRSLVALPILLAPIMFVAASPSIRPLSVGWSLLRSMLLVFMYIAIYVAIPLLDLSVIAASLYTAPLFISLLSAVWIGESVGGRRWAAVSIGFVGVLVILRPDTDAFSWYMLIPVIAGFLYALCAVITRAKCADESPQVLGIMLNLSLLVVGVLASILVVVARPIVPEHIVYPFLLGDWISMGYQQWKVISLLALLIVLIAIGFAKAYQVANPSIIATFDYTYLLFAALWGYLFFGETLDAASVIGMVLIVGAGFMVSEGKAARKTQTEP